jgi:putative MATE family efflux protein
MMWPLLTEQFLQLVVGLVDAMIGSHAGEAAISGISLVATLYAVFMFAFNALGVGGSVIISQYLGSGQNRKADEAGAQLYRLSALFSLACMALTLVFGRTILHGLYWKVTPEVMQAAETYLFILSFSLPLNALYNAGAAIFKSNGLTRTTMYITVGINLINIVGDYIGVFVLHAGVAGVAWPTTISWAVAMLIITGLCMQKKEGRTTLRLSDALRRDPVIEKQILSVAVPNVVENSLFQASKVVLTGVIATFGTTQLAANGIGQTIWNLSAMIGLAVGAVYTTVIGHTTGAGDMEASEYYLYKLTRITIVLSTLWNLVLTLALPLYMGFYNTTPEVRALVVSTTILHNIFTAFVSPLAQSMPCGFKAAGDVKYPMVTSLICTCGIRVALTFLLGVGFGMGLMGYMWAMCIDWSAKAVLMVIHAARGSWKNKRIIEA